MPPQRRPISVTYVWHHRDECRTFVWRYALGASEPAGSLAPSVVISDQIPTVPCVTSDEANKKMIAWVSIVVLRGEHIRAHRKQIVFAHGFAP
jgi:hypothetical protein